MNTERSPEQGTEPLPKGNERVHEKALSLLQRATGALTAETLGDEGDSGRQELLEQAVAEFSEQYDDIKKADPEIARLALHKLLDYLLRAEHTPGHPYTLLHFNGKYVRGFQNAMWDDLLEEATRGKWASSIVSPEAADFTHLCRECRGDRLRRSVMYKQRGEEEKTPVLKEALREFTEARTHFEKQPERKRALHGLVWVN